MLPNRASHRVFTVFALLAVLVLAGLPAQAKPVRHPLRAVAASGENGLVRIWSFFANLWPPQGMKEGMTIDPDGAPHHAGVTANPTGGFDDEGMSIDPDGRK